MWNGVSYTAQFQPDTEFVGYLILWLGLFLF